MKIVFLHGIGAGDPTKEWLRALNSTLEGDGHAPIDNGHVIAPRYGSFLNTEGISAKMPPLTYKPKNDARARREFERRQARVQRLLQLDPTVGTFGFNIVPDSTMNAAHTFGVENLSAMNLSQVRNYVENESVRGAILRHILDHLPIEGDIVLIAHSLGSVIAIDLLDHLPEDLHVRRFITLGSPANSRALHKYHERLLRKFPYSRVDDWSNFFSRKDPVTKGRGLASMLPGAQDFHVDIPGLHASKHYLAHPAITRLVADALFPTKDVATAGSNIAVRLSDEQALLLLQLHFARLITKNIKDAGRAQRYRDALQVLGRPRIATTPDR